MSWSNGQFDNQGWYKNAAGVIVYASFDPATAGTSEILSNGNLTNIFGIGTGGIARTLTNHVASKFYCEFTYTNSAFNAGAGLCNSSANMNAYWAGGGSGNQFGVGLDFNGYTISGGLPLSGTTTSPTFSTGQVGAMAIDIGAKKIWIKNLTSASNWNANGSDNPSTGVGGCSWTGTPLDGASIFVTSSTNSTGDAVTFNFGATAYTGTPPAGFGNW